MEVIAEAEGAYETISRLHREAVAELGGCVMSAHLLLSCVLYESVNDTEVASEGMHDMGNGSETGRIQGWSVVFPQVWSWLICLRSTSEVCEK